MSIDEVLLQDSTSMDQATLCPDQSSLSESTLLEDGQGSDNKCSDESDFMTGHVTYIDGGLGL